MAFNGSEHFPPGSVVPFFQSLGMTFGRDQNAFTSFEQTTFQLSLPDTETATLTKGMTFLADVLDRLSLLPKEIDAERQIIQEERIRSLSGRQRTMYYVLEHIAPGSVYGQRIPIGTEETINSVQQADFRDYYDKWYVPANATVIVVADTDPARIVTLLKKQFGSAPKKPRPTPQDPGIKPYQKSFAIVASDPEVQSEQLSITRTEPARQPTTTVPQFREDLVAQLATRAFNRRLDAKIAAGGTSYLSARASLDNEPGMLYSADLNGQPVPGKWHEALDELALELQSARAFGFSAREIEDAKKEIIARAERDVETEPTRPASALIRGINSAVTVGEPIMSAQQQLDLVNQLLPGITVDEVSQRFSTEFEPQAVAFVAVLPSSDNVPSEAELVQAGTKALAATPEKPTESARPTQLLAQLPTPGTVTDSSEHAASGVWSAWLSNNVRVHYRFMDVEKNQVTVSIALLGGEILETAQNRGVTQAAQVAWSRPATRRLSSSDIRDLMTGKKVSVRGGGMRGGRRGRRGGGGGSSDAITLTISGSPEDLDSGFQLAYLLLTEPKLESAAFTEFQTRLRQFIEESQHNPSRLGMRMASGAPYPPQDVRTQPVTVGQVDRLSEEEAQAWLDKLIANSPIEVVIVGDLPRERAVELVAQYLGALPSRERVSRDSYADLRKLTRPPGPRDLTEIVETETPQAFVMSAFYGPDETEIDDVRAMTLATRILSTRMVKQIREDEQLVYSISAGLRPGSTYPGFGLVVAASPTEPDNVARLVEKVAAMYATVAKDGVTDEELGVAKKQVANTLDEEMRSPRFWLARLSQMTFRGANLNGVINAPAAYQEITAEQVRKTFAKYYSPAQTVLLVVKPKEKPRSTP